MADTEETIAINLEANMVLCSIAHLVTFLNVPLASTVEENSLTILNKLITTMIIGLLDRVHFLSRCASRAISQSVVFFHNS